MHMDIIQQLICLTSFICYINVYEHNEVSISGQGHKAWAEACLDNTSVPQLSVKVINAFCTSIIIECQSNLLF